VTVTAGGLLAGVGPAQAAIGCPAYVTVFQTTSDGRWTGPGTSTSAPTEFTIDGTDLQHRFVTMGGVTRPRRVATFKFKAEDGTLLASKTTVASGDNGVIRQEPNVIAYDFAQPGQRVNVFADYRHRCGGDDVVAENVYVGSIVYNDPTNSTPPSPPDTGIPGGYATPSGPAAVAFQGTEHVFIRGLDNRIYLNRYDGTNWVGWSEVPGSHATSAALSAAVYFESLYLVHRGVDDRIYLDRTDGSSWASMGEVPGGFATPDAPVIVSYGAELIVAIRGFDNLIYHNKFNRFSGVWTGWAEVPFGGATLGGPAATVYNNGQVDVLELAVRGTDSRIYHNIYNPVTGWTGWSEVPGGGSTPSAPDLAVTGDSLSIVVRGFDDQLYINTFDGVTWTGWAVMASMAIVVDDPALSLFNGSLSVFTRLSDNQILRTASPLDGGTDLGEGGAAALGQNGAGGKDGVAAVGPGRAAIAAGIFDITCKPKSGIPILMAAKAVGFGSITCNYTASAVPSPMATLGVYVVLWRAVPAQIGGQRGFWSMAAQRFNASVGKAEVSESASKACVNAANTVWAVTTAHDMVPPPGYRPSFRVAVTASPPKTLACG
jgi:hypothetical protein